MPLHQFFFPDFLEIQRESFLNFLKQGILEEFSKRNPISNSQKNMEIFFYPEYFCLTKPDYSIQQAIFFKKSYTSKLYIPVQFTDKKRKIIFLKWILIAQLPLMTKRGHFVLNGAARVIINQLVRSPGVYFRENFYEIYLNKWISKPNKILKRFYADIICLKGTWIRIEIDKDFCMWVRLKKGPKIPLLWFLLGMGLNEKMIFQSVISPNFLLKSFQKTQIKNSIPDFEKLESFFKTRPNLNLSGFKNNKIDLNSQFLIPVDQFIGEGKTKKGIVSIKYPYVSTTPEAWKEMAKLLNLKKIRGSFKGGSKKNSTIVPFFLRNWNNTRPSFFREGKKKTSLTAYPFNKGYGTRDSKTINTTENKFINSSHVSSPLFYSSSEDAKTLIEPIENLSSEGYLQGEKKTKKNKEEKQKIRKLVSVLAQKRKKGNKTKKLEEKCDDVSLGRKWFFQRFMNPRTYDLGKKGRLALNQKLGLTIESSQTTLTGLDLLFITNYLMKVEKGLYPVDDIDHLKNKRIRSAGELIQIQFGIGLIRLEKTIRLKLNMKSKKNKISYFKNSKDYFKPHFFSSPFRRLRHIKKFSDNPFFPRQEMKNIFLTKKRSVTLQMDALTQGTEFREISTSGQKALGNIRTKKYPVSESFWSKHYFNTVKFKQNFKPKLHKSNVSLNSFIQPKYVNGALKEFFGTHPLSQFMDQINPLSEITHKRRLSSLGPGGVSRDTATLAVRGIHPSHYGRICPIETPEGKNTGLVNSLTVYARVNNRGFIEAPFYSLYKGQIQKSLGKFYLSAAQEEYFQTATADLNITKKNFLPREKIPVRFGKNFFTDLSKNVSFIGVSPLQMISLATSLIPFLEHDDANRALMGSNMQRQAVPLMRPQRPFVGTGLEAKAASDSGHTLTTSQSGVILYVSGSEIFLFSGLLNFPFTK